MAIRGLNPSFVPQLARYSHLVVTSPTAGLEDSSVVVSTADEVAKYGSALVVVLAPGLTARRRNEFREEFRKRTTVAAVLDDLDLVRLFNPGRKSSPQRTDRPDRAHPRAADLGLVPALSLDPAQGQHIQMEMYVGRNVDVELLSTTPKYSRVFSGRKLGKSALLKYIAETRTGYRLPSGGYLKVLYVVISGSDSEAEVAEAIIRALHDRNGFTGPSLPVHADPGKALDATLPGVPREAREGEPARHPRRGGQLCRSAARGSTTPSARRPWSWRMRSLELQQDEAGFPRIRFLLSGYRATQTREGAWANWGDVRTLKPLEPDEAIRLIEGPLARMGIDARAHAPAIAWRCGYQPAVLHKFGDQLIKHLDKTRVGPERNDVVVSAEDVSATFNDDAVQEEIRTVVRNNFDVDNSAARVVFSALLLELGELATGEALDDAAQRLFERLENLDPRLTWLQAHGSSVLGEIERMLSDFVARELVTRREVKGGKYVYSLRFPHHLAVLRHADPTAALRDDVRELSRSGEPRIAVRSVFERRELEELRFSLGPDGAQYGVKAVVASACWNTVRRCAAAAASSTFCA